MPFIGMTTNVAVGKDTELSLKRRFGEAIAIIPGKTEAKTMMAFTDGCVMYFKGDDAPMAFVEVKCFGSSPGEAYNELTGALCAIISDELGIDPGRIYVRYDETAYWGCNGKNL